MLLVLLIVSVLSACGDGDPLELCEGKADASARDECYAASLPELFRKDPALGEQLTQEKITDPQLRDFVYLTVTREIDPGSYRWCEKIKEPALAERCRVIVSRPHLHRELLNLGSGGTPPGGAPPPAGASAPGGAPPPGPLPGTPGSAPAKDAPAPSGGPPVRP